MKAEDRDQINRLRDLARDKFHECKQLASEIVHAKRNGTDWTMLQGQYNVDVEMLRSAYLEMKAIQITAPGDLQVGEALAKMESDFAELGEPLPIFVT